MPAASVKLWSLAIANMLVLVSPPQWWDRLDVIIVFQVLTLLATVTALPLSSQVGGDSPVSLQDPVEATEVSQNEDLAVEASSPQASHFRVPAAAKLAILAAANAKPTAVVRSPGYGKRSADNKDESEGIEDASETEDLAVEASNQALHTRVPSAVRLAILSAANAQPVAIDRSPGYGKRSVDDTNGSEVAEDETEDLTVDASNLQALHSRVPTAVRLAILSAANAEPAAVVRSPGYGKRSADSKAESETKLGLVDNVPLEAVKVVIHSSQGNIAQHYDGDTEYQNAVLGSRFGRGKRESLFNKHNVLSEELTKYSIKLITSFY